MTLSLGSATGSRTLADPRDREITPRSWGCVSAKLPTPGPTGALGFDFGSILGLSFAEQIRKFIEQAVQKAIQEALQALSLAAPGEQPQEQGSAKRRKRNNDRGGAERRDVADAVEQAEAAPLAEAKGAKGKSKAGKAGHKGKDQTAQPGAAGKGRGQGAPGKGKQPPAAEPLPSNSATDDDWVTVSRQKPSAPWQLRASDWSAPVFNFADVAGALDNASGTFKAVVLCDSGQADLLATLLLGSKKPHGVIAVTPDHPEAAARCPGAVGNSCVFKTVFFHHISSVGVDLPGPKVSAARAPKAVATKTAVLYVRVYKKYVTKAAWKDILASPQRAFHNWIAQQHLKVQDSWGWAKEQAQGEDSNIYALFRVPEAEVTAFVALSGRDGFFVDPPRWTTFPAFSVQWAEKEAKETDIDYLHRIRTIESKFGVVVGRRGLGKRIARDAHACGF